MNLSDNIINSINIMELKSTDNLHIYNQVKSVPADAQRNFKTAYGKELTDINAMWRIMKLTELFGPAGEGWYTEVTRQERVTVPNGEVMVFVDLNLYLKDSKTGKWSKPVRGTGGNRLVKKDENTGQFCCDDEAYKMAYTDALGIACKALGFGADIYWGKADSKFTSGTATIVNRSLATGEEAKAAARPDEPVTDPDEAKAAKPALTKSHHNWTKVLAWAASKTQSMSVTDFHRSITDKYAISDDDFCRLMHAVGVDVTFEDLKAFGQ